MSKGMTQNNHELQCDDASQPSDLRWQQVNRLLRTLSACNQAMIRAVDEVTLLQNICRIIVEVGEYRAAWIGFAELDAVKSIRPVAQAGDIGQYLQSLPMSWADNELGQGLTGTAIRTGQISIAQDILNDPQYSGWREAALQGGYAASIALPLLVETQTLGALHIYSAQSHAFDSNEVQLLSEVANDLAYGMTALRTRIQRQQTELALRESEAKFRAFLEMASEAVIISNSRGEIIIFNTKAEELFGYSPDEVLGQQVEILMPERFRQGHTQFRSGYTVQPTRRSMGHARNLYALRKDGTEFPIEAGLSSVEVGDERFVLTFLTDISERKRTEESLRESEERFRNMADNAPVMVWVADPTGYCTYLSQSWYDSTGQPEEMGLGFGWLDMVHPDDREQVEAEFLSANERQQSFRVEYRLLHNEGGYRWAIDAATPWFGVDGQYKGYIGSAIDITDRKQAEQASQENEARLKLAYQATRSGLWDWDVRSNSAHVSEEYCALFGLDPTQRTVSYEHWLSLVHPDDRLFANETISRIIEQQEDYYENEYRVLHPDGVRWLAARGQVFYDTAGNAVRMLGNMQDITERKQAELALSQLNEELEQRVADRTTELSQLNDRLQQELQERERIQEQLEEQAQLLDLAHDPILTRDPDGFITFWNRGAERVYGWTRAEALGQHSHTLLQTQFPQPLNRIEHTLSNQHYWEGEIVHIRRDGTPITVASRWVLQCDEEGTPLKVLEINNDITSNKRVEEVQARLAAIIESSDDAIISTNLEGIINSWNWGAEKLYGYSAPEIIGQSATVLLPADRSNEEVQLIGRLKRGDRIEHYETTRQHKEGRLIDVSLTASPIKNTTGEIIGMSKIARDITRRKQAEEQLHLSNERISLANAELARASRLKDEFLAGMSHELRTPLNAILGLSEALLEEIFGELSEEQREHLLTIEQSGKHLLELINDILDLSKVESGKMELEIRPVIVRELCDSSLSFIKQQAHQKRIKVTCRIDEELVEVELDERRIRQVLVNLLSNAVKFTPDGGSVQLLVRGDSFRETVEFVITDTGIGIAPENIGKLFQPFVQLDSSLSRRYSGTGLGLALVRRIAELHGGSVTLESQEGKGSRFTVTLPWHPLQPDAEAAPKASAIEPFPLNLQQVLIVEDSQAAASQIARYLNEMGAKTRIHPVGCGVVQMALQLKPNLIILDILLPDRSGWDVLAELKANPNTQTIPVIVVSVVDERLQAMELGASAYLLKPIARPQFYQMLNQVLHQANPAGETPGNPGNSGNLGNPGNTDPQPAMVLAETPSSTLPLILLVEDNEANIATLNSYLQARGFRVVLARNGLEAIQTAEEYKPNLILMDIQMPEMDGLEATQRIHSNPELRHIPIIALTALAMPGDREHCLSAGAVDYLTKPVSLKSLFNLLSQHLPQVNFSQATSPHES